MSEFIIMCMRMSEFIIMCKYYVYVAELLYTYVCDVHILKYYVYVAEHNTLLCVCHRRIYMYMNIHI